MFILVALVREEKKGEEAKEEWVSTHGPLKGNPSPPSLEPLSSPSHLSRFSASTTTTTQQGADSQHERSMWFRGNFFVISAVSVGLARD